MQLKTTAAPCRTRLALALAITLAAICTSLTAHAQPQAGDVPFVEKKWEQLPNQEVTSLGKQALEIKSDRWSHGETENFILHYRRVSEARRVAREIEFAIKHIAEALGAKPEQYKRKSHVYIFEDQAEWKPFLAETDIPEWAGSLAVGDELFLDVRREGGTGRFDSYTLAHETTHAVVARIYPDRRWPRWLNEGFSEYMAAATVAARKSQTVKRHSRVLQQADLSLQELEQIDEYPKDPLEVARLYQSAEKFVRYLMSRHPQEKFPQFVDLILGGAKLQSAVLELYGDEYRNWDDFLRRYERFTR